MTRLLQLLRQREFQLFAFCLLFMLVNWPFLGIPAQSGLMSIFSYLFVLWGLFILLLFLIQKTLSDQAFREDERDEGGD